MQLSNRPSQQIGSSVSQQDVLLDYQASNHNCYQSSSGGTHCNRDGCQDLRGQPEHVILENWVVPGVEGVNSVGGREHQLLASSI
jgi:hypothetical protein